MNVCNIVMELPIIRRATLACIVSKPCIWKSHCILKYVIAHIRAFLSQILVADKRELHQNEPTTSDSA